MANINKYLGLHRGPIDNKASSVINAISGGSIDMGDVVRTQNNIVSGHTLPKVIKSDVTQGIRVYGIAVGGDVDGIYGDGSTSSDDSNRATNGDGQGIVIVTQGRCPARVSASAGDIGVGDQLASSDSPDGTLRLAVAGEYVIARSLNFVTGTDLDIIAVDVQREGIKA